MQLNYVPTPTANECIDAIARFGGDQDAAAESCKLTRGQLAGIISSDPLASRRLDGLLRTLTKLDTAQTLEKANTLVRGTLADLEPKDLVRLVGLLSEAQSKLTDPSASTSAAGAPTQNNSFTFFGKAMEDMPPDVRKAIGVLVGDTSSASPATPTYSATPTSLDEQNPTPSPLPKTPGDALSSHDTSGGVRWPTSEQDENFIDVDYSVA